MNAFEITTSKGEARGIEDLLTPGPYKSLKLLKSEYGEKWATLFFVPADSLQEIDPSHIYEAGLIAERVSKVNNYDFPDIPGSDFTLESESILTPKQKWLIIFLVLTIALLSISNLINTNRIAVMKEILIELKK
jgi:hypothetical protein